MKITFISREFTKTFNFREALHQKKLFEELLFSNEDGDLSGCLDVCMLKNFFLIKHRLFRQLESV